MKYMPSGRLFLFGLLALLVTVPVLTYAQVFGNCNSYSYQNGYCGTGLLHVYVVTIPNSNNLQQLVPSNFTVVVNGQNASPSSFPGSPSGTNVNVSGSYTVQVLNESGYTPSYSVGCTNTVYQGQEATCDITMTTGSAYSSAPTPYQYPYGYPYYSQLGCAPSYQTVSLGQNANFTATGGSGVYNWSTPGSSYQAIGSMFNAVLPSAGVQMVTVANGTQVATCTVNVVSNGTPVSITPTYPNYPTTYPTYTTYPTAVVSEVPVTSYTAQYVPTLPNTGFAPMSATELALALVLVLGTGIFALPYVRKSFATIG